MSKNPQAIAQFNFDAQVFGPVRATLIHLGLPAKRALEKAYHDGTLAQWFPKETEYIKYHAKEFKDVWDWIVGGINQRRQQFAQRYPQAAQRWQASKAHEMMGKAGDWLRQAGIPAIRNFGAGLYGGNFYSEPVSAKLNIANKMQMDTIARRASEKGIKPGTLLGTTYGPIVSSRQMSENAQKLLDEMTTMDYMRNGVETIRKGYQRAKLGAQNAAVVMANHPSRTAGLLPGISPMGTVFSILSGAGLPPPSVTTLIASVSAKFLIAYAKDIAESYKNGTLAIRYPKIYNIVSRFINPNNTQLAFA